MRRTNVVALAIVAAACVVLGCEGRPPDRAHAIEQRLLAPCCWRESLVDHESGIADELRAEIRTRVARGDDDAAIESDLVARFGPQIRVEPASSLVGVAVTGVGVLALAVLVVWMRRRRLAQPAGAVIVDESERDRERLDDELLDEPA